MELAIPIESDPIITRKITYSMFPVEIRERSKRHWGDFEGQSSNVKHVEADEKKFDDKTFIFI